MIDRDRSIWGATNGRVVRIVYLHALHYADCLMRLDVVYKRSSSNTLRIASPLRQAQPHRYNATTSTSALSLTQGGSNLGTSQSTYSAKSEPVDCVDESRPIRQLGWFSRTNFRSLRKYPRAYRLPHHPTVRLFILCPRGHNERY